MVPCQDDKQEGMPLLKYLLHSVAYCPKIHNAGMIFEKYILIKC